MKISIIMATYNSESSIIATLDSILSQSYPDYEIIIMDGGSQDTTCAIIEGYNTEKITKFISEKDSGVYEAFNKGVKYAKGEWLFFLGSDDIFFSPTSLEELKLESNKEYDFVYTRILLGKKLYNPKYNLNLFRRNTIHHQGAIYKTFLFDNFKFDESFRISSDYELNLKLYLEKRKAKFLDIILTICGDDGLSSSTSLVGYKEEIEIRDRYIKNKYIKFFLKIKTLFRRQIKIILNKLS